MTFGMTLDWQRCNNEQIKRLAKLGDKLAKDLIDAYVALYRSRLDPKLQANWMKLCDEFCRRDLINTERRELENKYAHKLIEEQMPRGRVH